MTWKICIRGVVQGVGFRPFVWRAALDRNLKGSVANGPEGVVIKFNGTAEQASEFQTYILKHAPEMARITQHSTEPAPDAFFDNFTIEESEQNGLALLQLTPDVALCAACRKEIHDPASRRYRYAFTTCTICGPRYSILNGIPYDRRCTTMQQFEMCATCREEYGNPADRRFYAQTNSCPDCGIKMKLFDCKAGGICAENDQEAIMQQVVREWQKGAIVAIKGIGAYLLTCNASNPESIATLRSRKQRPTKPFALMYPDLAGLQKDVTVCETAAQYLLSPAAPIVLLNLAEKESKNIDIQGIAPGLGKIGAMLPNAPLFELLLRDFGGPIVATSGNISHEPLVYKDEVAVSDLRGIADFILLHNRDIIMPQDDSVLALRRITGQQKKEPVLLRRARGYAPAFLQCSLDVPEETVLALGAEMKGTFALGHLGNLHVSQYLGDLSDFDTQERYRQTLDHLLNMFEAKPSSFLGDLHPGYFSSQLGQSLAEAWNVPFIQVQHHEAHFAAVLAENDLLKTKEPVLGVIWDGTGLGSDGQIWGGEFFTCQSGVMERCAHFDYFPLLLGDKMPREPRISALAACSELPEAMKILESKFSRQEWDLYQKLLQQPAPLLTSSVGRIFDAIASLLELADKLSYEGEAAMLLEALAQSYCQKNGFDFKEDYANEKVFSEGSIKPKATEIFRQVISDIREGKDAGFIAGKFHYSMVKTIQIISNRLNINNIAFSGGVFQNTLLLDMIEYHLSADAQLFFHRQLSPNDENISFGQWARYTGMSPLRGFSALNQQEYVSRNSR